MPNPFLVRRNASITNITPRDEVKVVFYCEQDELVEVDPDDPKKFLTRKVPVVAEEIPLNAYIQQFCRDVDLKEKINRLRTKSEFDEFIGQTRMPETGAVYEQKDYLSDLQMEAIIKAGLNAWKTLPSELKKDLTKEEFMASFNEKMFASYVQDLVAKQQATKESEVKE